FCRIFPLTAACCLPANVRGPVECRHGWLSSAACLNRCLASSLSGPRLRRFRLLASDRRKLGEPAVATIGAIVLVVVVMMAPSDISSLFTVAILIAGLSHAIGLDQFRRFGTQLGVR